MCLWGKIREILEGDRELSSESEDSTFVHDEPNSSLDPEFEAVWDLSKILEISFKGGMEAVLLRLCEIEKELRSEDETFAGIVKQSFVQSGKGGRRAGLGGILKGSKMAIKQLANSNRRDLPKMISDLEGRSGVLEECIRQNP
ncbi:hypothetical protein V6N11_050185 [Hibiscus sabdariffa]|uniref:Uncharacterized protein n=1 Tax=Hibiscus sabdariffa TaxID=183260 RepID=A0ABR2T934_9ROSI